MSHNLLISAEREITFKKKNGDIGTEIQQVNFDCFQTSTEVTNHILESENNLNSYIDYVIFLSEQEKKSNDDYEFFLEHIEILKNWINEKEEDGFIIKYSSI